MSAPRAQAIGLALRRAQPGAGSDLEAMLWIPPAMRPWWRRADADLRSVPHAVVGGVAAIHYMPPRETQDVDFAVAIADRDAAEGTLAEKGYRRGRSLFAGQLVGRHFTSSDGHPVDLIYLPPRCAPAIASAQRNRIDGLPVATLPWLVYLKLDAGRLQDTADLGRMLGHQDAATLARVRRRVREMGSAQDLEDLDQIIELGRREYGRAQPRRRSGGSPPPARPWLPVPASPRSPGCSG